MARTFNGKCETGKITAKLVTEISRSIPNGAILKELCIKCRTCSKTIRDRDSLINVPINEKQAWFNEGCIYAAQHKPNQRDSLRPQLTRGSLFTLDISSSKLSARPLTTEQGRNRSKLNEVSGEDFVLELEGGESLKVGDILFQKLGHRHTAAGGGGLQKWR
ncbi:hypothetical protein HKD37_12G034744 [Glycine soja]